MIYFIQCNNGPIKIGYTNRHISERLKELKTSSPYSLKLLALLEGEREIEADLKNTFSFFRRDDGGEEWFDPVKPLMDLIDECAKKHACFAEQQSRREKDYKFCSRHLATNCQLILLDFLKELANQRTEHTCFGTDKSVFCAS